MVRQGSRSLIHFAGLLDLGALRLPFLDVQKPYTAQNPQTH